MGDNLKDILQKYWGYKDFRPRQQEIMESVCNGKDTLALLPTGGGKSLCFQIPALAKEGLCIVVTPLIALMKDQVENLQKKGVKATAIYTGMGYREIDHKLEQCAKGYTRFLYVSPERLQTDLFQERLTRFNVSLLAVDEAHCISEWGYDFRPAYLKIADIRELIPRVPVIALTATATIRVRDDIIEHLNLKKPKVFQNSFSRPNIIFGVSEAEDKDAKLLQVLKNIPGCGIIYQRSRVGTEKLSNLLARKKFSTTWYHAGLSGKEREKRQIQWQNNKTQLMVATNAFGMGIDKPDVRKVIHTDLPDSPEAYYQEAGRAGRDGKKSYAVVITHPSDQDRLLEGIEQKFPPVSTIKDIYHAIANHLQIPIGSGAKETFNFDIKHFCHKYNQKPVVVYNTLKILEQENYLAFSENSELPARMMFLINYRDLYEFQIENKQYEPLIKVILRNYPGVMEEYVRISEKETAEKTGISEEQTYSMLDRLRTLKVLDYQEARDKPQLMFLTNRVDKSQLTLDQKRLNQRKAIYREKVEGFLHYCFVKDKCRTRILLDYFGENTHEDCGHCDNCIKKKQAGNEEKIYEEIRGATLEKLKSGSIPHKELIAELQNTFNDEEKVLKKLRSMVDENEIKLDENGNLKLCT